MKTWYGTYSEEEGFDCREDLTDVQSTTALIYSSPRDFGMTPEGNYVAEVDENGEGDTMLIEMEEEVSCRLVSFRPMTEEEERVYVSSNTF